MSTTPFSLGMITTDCRDPQALAGFWSEASGAPIVGDYGDFVIVGTKPALGFQRSQEPTPGKNRVHLDGGGGDRGAQVQRLLALGATAGETHSMPGGLEWTVMSDPEGNVFCVSNETGANETGVNETGAKETATDASGANETGAKETATGASGANEVG